MANTPFLHHHHYNNYNIGGFDMSKDSNATDSNSSLEYKFPEKNYNLDERFADYVKSQEGKYISKEGRYYIVSREIKGERFIFGKFTTLEFAKEYERNIIINSWNNHFKSYVSYYGKYLTKENDKFYIYRTVKGEKRLYGTFDYLSDAIEAREKLIENNWGFKKPFETSVRYDPNITYSYMTFKISKRIDGEWQHFGKYDTYEDALVARDILLENNWDASKIPERLISANEFIVYRRIMGEWEICNVIDDTMLSFGLFEKREDAKEALEILRANNWNSAYVPFDLYAENSFIYESRKKGGVDYSVVRGINGRAKSLAFFDNREDAVEFRNQLLLSNWEMIEEDEEEKWDVFVYQVGDKFIVRKDGVVYGEFDRICDAIDFQRECIKKNWNFDDL